MLRCFISEGQIYEGPCRVPKAWRNISGLDKLDEAGLIALGWLPFIDVKPAYDKDTQYITGSRVITAEAVTMNNVVNDYTAEELASRLLSAQTARKVVIRGECETRILSAYPMWMQTNGANGLDPEADVTTMLTDIGAMRTESNRCEDAVDAAETQQAVRDVTATWPIEEPEVV